MSITIQAGFSRDDITPSYSVPLAGYGNTKDRMSLTVLDRIYASCVAVCDGENKALFYHLDLVRFTDDSTAYCKKVISESLGINPTAIFFTATHTHSAPDVSSDLPCIRDYLDTILHPVVIRLASEALADMEDATITIGHGKTRELNFVRRYLLSDGSYGGDNFGDFVNNTILAHETEADPEMQVIRWNRKSKKDILMVNWQSHPHRTGGSKKYDLSSDLIEHFRRATEARHEFYFSYHQGCAGNLNTHSRVPEEGLSRDHVEIGHFLADVLDGILENMRPVKSGKIQCVEKVFTGEVNHAWDSRVEDAIRVQDLMNGNQREEGRALALELGFNSVYHASAVIMRSKMPATHSYPISAISIGDLGFIGAPNELYDVTGIYLKASSPFEMTFVCSYTNGSHGYMPTVKAFAHGGYGCDTCRFPSGVTEKLTAELLGLLVQLYEEKKA